ncbi:NAD-dependent epimerase/dehydratase family protein [Gracilibacillus xinjiangensis]|uniref:NAD-dependent epimerase/dehydratase family protein n=1 Tax=Gracilibacillus xinjiangensis TaxID=1193282 RepID=A0ABV8WU07_9BACI
MKKLVIIGGGGTVGKKLFTALEKNYQVLVLDNSIQEETSTYRYVDATDYDQLLDKIPQDTDVLINLLRIETNNAIEEADVFNKMTDVFFKASYYLMLIAKNYNISRVIFASTNHVTDYYEENGFSKLDREITTTDYPAPKGLYGVLKLASEHAGFIFSYNTNLSVINIRIGSVPSNEKDALEKDDRLKRTLLSESDLINLFEAAIETDRKYGTYYGVSDNKGKPWDLSNAISEIGYKPE